MTSSNLRPLALLAVFVVGCGAPRSSDTSPPDSGGGALPDAGGTQPGSDAAVAPVDAGFMLHCDYTESQDLTNDYYGSNFMLEQTGLVFTGASQTICGVANNGHYDPDYDSVDIDDYGITVGSDADVLITLSGSLGPISQVGVWVYDPVNNVNVGGGYFVGTHGAASMHVPAGTYQLSVEAYDNHDAAAPIPYHVTIAADQPLVRCPTLHTPATYIETHDGLTNTANDMIDIDYTLWPSEYMYNAAGELAEPTGMSVENGYYYHVTGVSAANALRGSYFDHDTYTLTAGGANQIAVRLDWASSTVDLDYYLFTDGTTFPLASSATWQLGGEEFATFAVAPGATYWLWVGADEDSTGPSAYDISVCGESFDE